MNYVYLEAEAARAEERIPSMTYRMLLDSLGQLSDLRVIGPRSPATMLVTARLIDRARIQQSGITASELRNALVEYRNRKDAVHGVVKALERAIEFARTA